MTFHIFLYFHTYETVELENFIQKQNFFILNLILLKWRRIKCDLVKYKKLGSNSNFKINVSLGGIEHENYKKKCIWHSSIQLPFILLQSSNTAICYIQSSDRNGLTAILWLNTTQQHSTSSQTLEKNISWLCTIWRFLSGG